jgi:superoxide dismutase, Cu-Zn family
MVKKMYYIVAVSLMIAITGCAADESNPPVNNNEAIETFNGQPVFKAAETAKLQKEVDLINTDGKKTGLAVLTQMQKGVLVQVYIEGLKPGRHGFHVHETGKCDAPKFESAGGHFNPTHKKHGYNNPAGYHAGDIPNLVVDENGIGKGEFFVDAVSLEIDQANSLLDQDGSTLMIHSGADDYSTDPAGNSGDRVACGVIE